eukprot:753467-Pyramimonas_sp.AAC.1
MCWPSSSQFCFARLVTFHVGHGGGWHGPRRRLPRGLLCPPVLAGPPVGRPHPGGAGCAGRGVPRRGRRRA